MVGAGLGLGSPYRGSGTAACRARRYHDVGAARAVRAPATTSACPACGAVARTDLAAATLRSLRDGPAPLVALTGGPGFGKSVLARLVAAVVDTPAASEAGNGGETWCPGGVVWLDVGQDPDLPRLLARQLADLTGQPAGAQSAGQLASDLGEELADRRSLLVLDDVWPPRTGKADLVGLVLSRIKNVPRLVTTRSASFLDAELGTRRIDVEEMDQDEAAALLATALPGQATENEAAQLGDFGQLLGRWPLLLGLAAAHLRRQVYGGVPLATRWSISPPYLLPRVLPRSTSDTRTYSMPATPGSGTARLLWPLRPASAASPRRPGLLPKASGLPSRPADPGLRYRRFVGTWPRPLRH